jgi:hypothetical protein
VVIQYRRPGGLGFGRICGENSIGKLADPNTINAW